MEALYYKFLARDILGRAGWVINESKSQVPDRKANFLGSVIDTVNM